MECGLKKPLLFYFAAWAIAICAFWCNYDTYYISFVLMPVLTFGVAVAMAFGGCDIAKGFMTALCIGVSYMLGNYFTLSFANMFFNQYARFHLPYPEYILYGGVIFLSGFLVGKIAGVFKRQ